jgi:hypothetical protein
MQRSKVFKPYKEWREEKENFGKFTWTLALYGTEAMAKEAGMSLEDPRAAREAGRTYVAGLAHCDGAFHPKLMLIVGPERALVAIGSGNLTLAGWGFNTELWTVTEATNDNAPNWLTNLAIWLEAIPSVISMGQPAQREFHLVAILFR